MPGETMYASRSEELATFVMDTVVFFLRSLYFICEAVVLSMVPNRFRTLKVSITFSSNRRPQKDSTKMKKKPKTFVSCQMILSEPIVFESSHLFGTSSFTSTENFSLRNLWVFVHQIMCVAINITNNLSVAVWSLRFT